MKIQIFTGTFNPSSKTYVLDTDGTTPLALAISNAIGSITPLFINQTQSSPPQIPPTISLASNVYTPAIVPVYPNLTISIYY